LNPISSSAQKAVVLPFLPLLQPTRHRLPQAVEGDKDERHEGQKEGAQEALHHILVLCHLFIHSTKSVVFAPSHHPLKNQLFPTTYAGWWYTYPSEKY